MDPRFIDDLARRLSAVVPPGISALGRDLEQNFKAVLQSGLARLDLVSRQEFDVQAAVLRRTREKLEALEARLAALESPAGRLLQGQGSSARPEPAGQAAQGPAGTAAAPGADSQDTGDAPRPGP